MRELDLRALHHQGRNVLAFSGGPDSVCLLHLLIDHGLSAGLKVVHVDHGLDAGSHRRARQAVEIAVRLGVDCSVERLAPDDRTGRGGPEATARRARYTRLARHLKPGDHLLTAHHADDQVETVLLRLLRGAGPRGLAGMRVRRALPPGQLGRPLLAWPRTEILDWLDTHGLDWVDDPTNADQSADRNYLRLEVLPLLERRWPGVREAVLASAGWQREADTALEDRAARDLAELSNPAGASLHAPLDARAWRSLGPRRARAAFRHWCDRLGLTAPPDARLRTFFEQGECAFRDRQPLLDWPAAQVRLWRERIWLDPRPLPPEDWRLEWDFNTPLALPGGGHLELRGQRNAFAGQAARLGPVRAGERIESGGLHRRIHELLRLAGVPPWRRARVPVLRIADRVCAVGDLIIADAFAARLEASGARLHWQRPPAFLLSEDSATGMEKPS